MTGELLIGIVAFGLLIGLAAALVGLLADRKIFGGGVEVAMRRSGETRWRHGRLEVDPGRLVFRPSKWQMRFASGDPIEVAVRTVAADTGRRPSKKQMLSVNPSLHVIDIETDGGILELGVQAHQVDDLRARLQPTDDLH